MLTAAAEEGSLATVATASAASTPGAIKERAQSFNYTLGITLTVNFGSIYNNVVNNRMQLGPLSFN